MADENKKIDQEELDRIEDELLEEARRNEEKMRVEGKSVFELQRLKDKKSKNDEGEEAQK